MNELQPILDMLSEAVGRDDVMVVAVVAVLLLLVASRLRAKTTPIETPGLPPIADAVLRQNISNLAKAIGKAEGWGIPGAIPTVRNNPGNLKLPGSGGEITTFKTVQEGWDALESQLLRMYQGRSNFYTPDMSLIEIARIWTGEAAYRNWSTNVSRVLGIPPESTLKQVLEA